MNRVPSSNSDEWIADRGKLLAWVTKAGHHAGGAADGRHWTLFDKGTDTTVEVDSAAFLSWWLPEHSVRFGGSGAERWCSCNNDFAWGTAA